MHYLFIKPTRCTATPYLAQCYYYFENTSLQHEYSYKNKYPTLLPNIKFQCSVTKWHNTFNSTLFCSLGMRLA